MAQQRACRTGLRVSCANRAADEGADGRVERLGLFEIAEMSRALDRLIMRAGDHPREARR